MLVLSLLCYVFFFFSSTRRHTRLQGDWSSDVCSSDLCEPGSGLAHANWVASLWVCCSVWSGAMGYEPEESPWTPVDDAPFLFIRTTRVARNRGSPEEDGWRI